MFGIRFISPENQEKYLIGKCGFGVVGVWTAIGFGRKGNAVVDGLVTPYDVLVAREVVGDNGVVGFAVVTLAVEVVFVGRGFVLVTGILPEVVATNFVVVIVFCVDVTASADFVLTIEIPDGAALQFCITTMHTTNKVILNIFFLEEYSFDGLIELNGESVLKSSL